MLTTPKTTLALSATVTITADAGGADFSSQEMHTISITGSGVVTIAMKHLDQTVYTNQATGVTADTSTYPMKGCTGIKITETGGAAAVEYSIVSY